MKNSQETFFSQAINLALDEILNEEPYSVLLGEDIGIYGGAFGVTRELINKYGSKRVVDLPISECGFVGMAIGASLGGLKPIVEIMFMDFLLLALDPIVNKGSKINYLTKGTLPFTLVIRTAAGGGRSYGPDHSQSFEAILTHIPEIQVYYPANANDAYGLLKAAIRQQGITVFIESKALYSKRFPFDPSSQTLPPGKSQIVHHGKDWTLVSYGRMLWESELAAQMLIAKAGISVELIDIRTLRPLDIDSIINSLSRTHRLAVVEESPPACGIGAHLVAQIAASPHFYLLDIPPVIISPEDKPIPFSKDLENKHFPSAITIAQALQRAMENNYA